MRTIESITTYNSGTFPNTLGVNSTGPSTKDGTELHANIFNDYIGVFPQALLNEMGMSASGNAETATVCQQLDAMKGLISRLGNGWGVIGRAAVDTVHDVTLSVGAVPDSTRQYMLRLTAEITKQIDAAWTAGSNAGGLMGGAFSANTEYGLYLIYNPTTRVLDAGFSVYTGAGVPTFLPAGYTVYQMVDWVRTDATPNIIQYSTKEIAGNKIKKTIITTVLDANLASLVTSGAGRLDAIGVASGFKCDVNMNTYIQTSSSQYVNISDPDTTDQLPSASAAPLGAIGYNGTWEFNNVNILTNTSKQIRSRSNSGTVDFVNYSVRYFEFNRF